MALKKEEEERKGGWGSLRFVMLLLCGDCYVNMPGCGDVRLFITEMNAFREPCSIFSGHFSGELGKRSAVLGQWEVERNTLG